MEKLAHINIPRIRCNRCGYEWVVRKSTPPKVCARCKNPNWWKAPRVKVKVKTNE